MWSSLAQRPAATRRHDRAVLPVEAPREPRPRLTSVKLRQAGVARLDARVQLSERHAEAHVAVASEIRADREAHEGPDLAVPRDHGIVAHHVERPLTHARRPGDKERGVAERPIQLRPEARLGAGGAVDPQLGAGSEQVEGQVPRGELKREVIARRVLEAEAEHEKRRRITLRAGFDPEPGPAVDLVELPSHRFVPIQSGQRLEIHLEGVEVERLSHARREDLLDAGLI